MYSSRRVLPAAPYENLLPPLQLELYPDVNAKRQFHKNDSRNKCVLHFRKIEPMAVGRAGGAAVLVSNQEAEQTLEFF